MIHPTAIIDSKAEIDTNVSIGPYSFIGADVSIGSGTVIGPHAVIEPYVTIGPDCKIFQYAAIGATPQSVRFEGGKTYVKIGRNCIIREFVTIHRGTEFGGGITEIGDNCYLMNYVHIAHDCKLGRGVVFANNASLAGHITIGDHVTTGGFVAIHQPKDIPPYVIAEGHRAKLHGLNKVGLKRHGFSEKTLSELKKAYRIIYRIGLTLNEATERVNAEVEPIPEVLNFISFIKSIQRGLTR
ncbi:MAG: acyl-ACP--UDP-N-acetylglucosamine O-acyltransferase [Deltaproteobacteria bacterium]|nr:acyl-ACP--UDP-N-acetylglucosamine O-acyltransferase [Deltaproteobacteria bacterium]